jgi:outer membrane protein TolC
MTKRWLLLLLAIFVTSAGTAQPKPMTLQEAIDFAMASSPALKAARADLLAVVANERAARAMAGPQISANILAATGNNSSIQSSVPKTDPAVAMMIPAGDFAAVSLMLMAPVYAPEVRAMAASATWQARAAAGDIREAEAELVLAVREAFYTVKYMREEALAARANLEALRELLRTTQARFESGATIEASVQRVEAEVRRSESELKSAGNNEAKALLDFIEVIGGDLGAEILLADVEDRWPVQVRVAEAVDAGLANRGVLLAAEARTKAAEAELRAARAFGSPRLYATGMAEATSRRDMGGLSAGLALSFPLYDGGRVRSEAAKARAMRDRAGAELALARLGVEKQVRQAALDLETAKANLDSARAAVAAARSSYEVVAVRVEAGRAILLEQLDALEVLTRSRSDLAKARLDLMTSVARLERATGVNP